MRQTPATHIPRVFSLLAVALLLGASPALAQTRGAPGQGPQAANLNKNGALILIRSALIAVDAANKTGNYTVLRDLGSPEFQSANTAARLAEIFAAQRQANLDLSGVAAIEPQLDEVPIVDANGKLRLVGNFPSVPQQINFQLLFAASGGQWKLFGVGVNVGQPGPAPAAEASPPPPPPAAPAARPPKPEAKPAARPAAPRPAARRERPEPKQDTAEPAE